MTECHVCPNRYSSGWSSDAMHSIKLFKVTNMLYEGGEKERLFPAYYIVPYFGTNAEEELLIHLRVR